MNKYIFLLAIFLLPVSASGQNIKRDSLLIFDWKFHKGNIENASNPDFNDKDWRLLDLPHDWSMEDLETAGATGDHIISGPFDSQVASKRVSTLINNQVPSDIKMDFQISDPDVWSTENPKLYKAICTISARGNILDIAETNFGIRSLKFNSEKGFFLNGKSMKLKGGALHANNGPLGAATFERAEERRVELMKKAGFNAVRCGHNPPSSAFLNACDRLGLMVIDETFDVWTIGWLPDDYHVFFNCWWKHDVKNMLLRDRNHPSIIAWGIGKQLRENSDSTGISLAYEISDYVRSFDNNRPVTANLIVPQMKRNAPPEFWYKCDPFFAALDICGYSYQTGNYLTDHERLPDRIMYSAEIDPGNSFDNWMKTIDNEFIIGNFEWTAMDFMGEVELGWFGIQTPPSTFPWNSTYSGDLDLCGFKRPRSYYRDILFGIGREVSVFVKSPVPSFERSGNSRWGWDDVKPSWTWPGFEKQQLQVDVYSSCDSVELSLNGKTLGTKPASRETEFKASWQVPYEKGTLKAIGYQDNKISETSELQTAGRPYRIRLT